MAARAYDFPFSDWACQASHLRAAILATMVKLSWRSCPKESRPSFDTVVDLLLLHLVILAEEDAKAAKIAAHGRIPLLL